jgi:hypothetical protein
MTSHQTSIKRAAVHARWWVACIVISLLGAQFIGLSHGLMHQGGAHRAQAVAKDGRSHGLLQGFVQALANAAHGDQTDCGAVDHAVFADTPLTHAVDVCFANPGEVVLVPVGLITPVRIALAPSARGPPLLS